MFFYNEEEELIPEANLDLSAPVITSGNTASIETGRPTNQVVYQATATDNDTITWSLKQVNDYSSFSINQNTGQVTLLISPNISTKSSYLFTVVASDPSNNTSEKTVTLSVVGVVSSGLTLHFDARNTASYPGSGTTLYDLTGVNPSFSLVGTTFGTSGYIKYFYFGNNEGDRIAQANSTVFSGSNTYTAEYWLRNAGLSPAGQEFYALISYNVSTTNEVLHYYRNTEVEIYHANSLQTATVYGNASEKTQWHHLAIAVSSSSIRYYVNGVLKATKSRVENSTFRTGYFVFGQEQDSAGGGFQTSQDFYGYLSQLRVYKGKTLTQQEIQQNYNNTKWIFGL
jgi:hypothetical protein